MLLLAAGGLLLSPAALFADRVRSIKQAGPDFDSYTANPTLAQQQWMRDHFWRMEAFTPYFDSRTSWDQNTWFYYDSYAIYNGSALASQHPEWILKDQSGKQLFIPWGCGGGTCPQYAADIGNPAFRSWWISTVISILNRGYRGIWIDDVNLEFRVGDGNGNFVAPWDPRTGAVMTYDNWRRYFAEFMEQVRRDVPGSAACAGAPCEITHNPIWFAAPTRTSDPYVQREIASADYINIERGFNDDGIQGGSGSWSLEALLQYIDAVHAAGKGVNMMDFTGPSESTAKLEYGLAGYFLISSGKDTMTNTATPDQWWVGYDADPGTPTGNRYNWNGLRRRDYTGGMVLMNEPNAPTITVTLPGQFIDLYGKTVSSVTLAARQGAVLRGTSDKSAPIITAVSTAVSGSGAAISWNTNELSDTQVDYGTTTGYGQSSALSTSQVAVHQVALSGLAAGTTYHFRVKSRDASGNLATSGDGTFSIAGAGNSAPVVSSVSPADGASVPAAGLQISAAFSKPMNATSINSGTIQLRVRSTAAVVGAAVGYSASANTVTATPSAALTAGTAYSVTIKGGTSGVQDSTGSYMAADRVWSFTATGGTGSASAYPVSDLTWSSVTNGWGPVEKDRSNGETAAGDGHTITLRGVTYPKGLGVHAASTIHYALAGAGCSSFTATAGVDDEVQAGAGSVIFQVWGDGVKLFESPRLVSGSAPASVNVNLAGRNDLALTVTDAGDGNGSDHADWANPILNCTGAPAAGRVTRYLSDMTWASMTNGWGPAELDRSNGEAAAGDGHPITLSGTTFAKGLGVHAASTIHYALNGSCSQFGATVGVDDEVQSGAGSVTFQVFADGAKLFESSRLVSHSPSLPVSLDVSGRRDLALIVTDAGDGNGSDHADWADARVTCTP